MRSFDHGFLKPQKDASRIRVRGSTAMNGLASADINAGDAIFRKSVRTTLGTMSTSEGKIGCVEKICDGRFAVTFNNAAGSQVVIGNEDQNTGEITYSNSLVSYSNTGIPTSLCRLTDTTMVAQYTQQLSILVYDPITNTLSKGANYAAPGTPLSNEKYGIEAISETNFCMIYTHTTKASIVAATVSGTVITFGTPTVVGTNTLTATFYRSCYLGNGRFVGCYGNYYYAATVSGLTLSNLSAETILAINGSIGDIGNLLPYKGNYFLRVVDRSLSVLSLSGTTLALHVTAPVLSQTIVSTVDPAYILKDLFITDAKISDDKTQIDLMTISTNGSYQSGFQGQYISTSFNFDVDTLSVSWSIKLLKPIGTYSAPEGRVCAFNKSNKIAIAIASIGGTNTTPNYQALAITLGAKFNKFGTFDSGEIPAIEGVALSSAKSGEKMTAMMWV